MDRVFRQREDWFEVGIVPAIRRRTIIGVLLIGVCIAAWLYWESWAPLVVAAIVIAERAFEFAHIPKTKNIIGSSNILATENGLTFRGSRINGSVVYPWSSLTYRVVNKGGGEAEAILIEDRARKNSKQKLVGYEGMSELVALIEGNAEKP
jgi:hypothetical protein